MGITYENQRVVFDQIVRKYKEYVELYKSLNNGSVEGVSGFDDFYWRMTYFTKYLERKSYGTSGY